ncbi:response regulator [Oscillatoria sp. FACHB-1407]|uniref:response regulator n=1 Tax=Oscillatoria sp. FACHB-1407 TaxID=2692847 RepID=UPI001683F799|nr:response regulator [Oscillatoria sp. FACHB-1407]MBD2462544.1 response regulator [Oscillatoria sp. FACHB-1407]
MADSQRLVLMIQPNRLQGLIWQAVLKSQRLAVIWESPETNLEENLTQLQQAGLALPDLLLVDVRLRDFNPYAFCRWCRDHCPDIKVVLVNASKKEIIPSERQWAVLQGAADLLPAFDPDNLVTTVADGVKRVLKILDEQALDNGSLISVLLNIKRELERRANSADVSVSNGKAVRNSTPDTAIAPPLTPEEPSGPLSKLKDNRSIISKFINQNPPPPSPQKRLNSNGHNHNGAVDIDAEAVLSDEDLPTDDPPPTRMYRGRKY